MKSIGICVNNKKDMSFDVTKNIMSIVSNLGAKCEIAEIGRQYDFVISVGGDGTFLATARNFSSSPIVGINLGNMGFLSEIDKDTMVPEIAKLLTGDFVVDERFFLETTVNGRKLYALNDMVISRGLLTKLLNLRVFFGDEFVDDYRADGLIVSTPTGSTAYSLSAGGPIVDPHLDVLVISPICAHSLHQRPIVISSNTVVKINSKNDGFMVMADGQESVCSDNVYDIVIKRSDKVAKVIKVKNNCFFDVVRRKFYIN